MKNATLRLKMRLLILALLVAIGGGSVLAFRWLSTAEATRRVQENTSETSRVLSKYVKDTQAYLLGQVTLVANLPTMKNTAATGDPATIRERLDYYIGSTSLVEHLALVDMDGKFIAKSVEWPKFLGNHNTGEALHAAANGADWGGIISEGGQLNMLVATKVSSKTPYVQGVLLGVTRISDDTARELRFGEGSEVVFLKDKTILASSIPLQETVTELPLEPEMIHSNGRDYMGLYRPLPGTDPSSHLGFISLRDYDNMVGPYTKMGSVFFVILGTMMCVGLLLGDRFAKGLVTPLDDVVKAAAAMRRGQTPTPFNVGNRRDEVGVLQTVFNDMVSAVEENQKLLLGMIDTDPLTGLLNHRSFQEKVRGEAAKARTAGLPLALCLIDLDSFHEYNSTHGHAEGDLQLKGYASLLRAACPGNAILARYAGDQFGVLLPRTDAEEAEQIAKQIKKAVAQSKNLIQNSIGIAVVDERSRNDEALVLSSELALSRAKQLGRNRISRFESDLASDSDGNSQLLHQYLADGSLATVQALAAAVDAKDQYTKGHSERVANLARDLAEYMKCSPAFVELVYRAGTLHDVGKIGVPDAILSKPTVLTVEEMSVMATHPVLGELIVGKVPQLAVLLPGVRNHHERWDGTGYPDRLQGDQIPMIARYLTVADTFDAMTSDRPYRSARPVEVALKEIEQMAGSQFQPELAAAFVRMIRETAAQPV